MWGSGNLGGTSLLNFKVVGGLTQPDNPNKNTIWVNTDIPISEWSFSAVEPENHAEGMVWISTGTSSTVAFSATKKNPIMIYPLAAKQYIGGAWVDLTAKSYQGGEWVEWIKYLYNAGNECEDITGGWALSTNYVGSHGDSLKKNAASMVFSSSFIGGSHYAYGFLRTNNKIDLSETISITVRCNSVDVSDNAPLYLIASAIDTANAFTDAAAYVDIPSGATVVSLDVSSLNGNYHVGIAAAGGGDTGDGASTVDINTTTYE